MATLRANISGKEHDIDNWEMALATTNYIIICLAVVAIKLAYP